MFDQEKDKYADVMSVEDFISCVRCGAFTPDDGIGYYGTDTHYSYEYGVWDSGKPKGTTHVHWYNK